MLDRSAVVLVFPELVSRAVVFGVVLKIVDLGERVLLAAVLVVGDGVGDFGKRSRNSLAVSPPLVVIVVLRPVSAPVISKS